MVQAQPPPRARLLFSKNTGNCLTVCDLTESESDDSIAYPSNRGRKLKRRARYVREGQLDAPTGPKVYKEVGLVTQQRTPTVITKSCFRKLSMGVYSDTSSVAVRGGDVTTRRRRTATRTVRVQSRKMTHSTKLTLKVFICCTRTQLLR